jgi:hypothetical protein
MMWAPMLMLLCLGLLVAIWWKPGKGAASFASLQQSAAQFTTPAKVDALEQEIAIIAEAIRERETAKRKAAAMNRLREFLSEE